MRCIVVIICAVLTSGVICHGQHLIDIDKSQVTGIVRKEMKEFSQDNTFRNEHFNYVKFVNSSGTKTLFVFFDENDISVSTRLVCDYSEWDVMLKKFRDNYRKSDHDSWEYSVNNEWFAVSLERKEWYFVVGIKKKVVEQEKNKRFFRWKRRSY